MNLLIFVITGLLLIILFRVLNQIAKVLIKKTRLRKGALRILPLAELVAWTAFSFWGVFVIFGQHHYYDLIVVIMAILVVFGLAWFVFRDFLAGVLLRSEKALYPGQIIKTPIVEGKVRKMGFRGMQLINDKGETVTVPYSRLSNQLLIIPPEKEDSLPHQVKFSLPPKMASESIREKVYTQLVAMPWVISPAPEVSMEKSEDSSHVLHVTYYTYTQTHAVIVEEKIRKILDEHPGGHNTY